MKWNSIRKDKKYITRAAFADLPWDSNRYSEHIKPTWTCADEDHDGLYSFRKHFLMYYTDPTELTFVRECFEGDLKHWEAFKNAREIKGVYQEIKKEAEMMLMRDAFSKIIEIAGDTNNKSSMTALKYLADRGAKVLGEPANKGGRPKKEDIAKAAREIAEEDKDLKEDLARINGNAE